MNPASPTTVHGDGISKKPVLSLGLSWPEMGVAAAARPLARTVQSSEQPEHPHYRLCPRKALRCMTPETNVGLLSTMFDHGVDDF